MDLNETYDFLMQIRRKEIIIRRKETQRDELRACLLPGAIRYDRDRVQSTPTDKMADVIARVDELDRSGLTASKENKLVLYTCVADEPELRWCVTAKER